MEIFYIDSEQFLKTHNSDFLKKYTDGKEFQSEKRLIQYSLGRFLVKSAGENFYGLKNPEVEIFNNKPSFKEGKVFFSISHSANYVAAAFDTAECGLDIEKMKHRNFKLLAKRYKRDFNSIENFYKFWTEYEAEIKLQQKIQGKFSCIFQDDFMLTAVSANSAFSEPSCINNYEIML